MRRKEKGRKLPETGEMHGVTVGCVDLPITPPASRGLHCYSSHIPLNRNSGIKTGKTCLHAHFWKVLVSIGWIIHHIFHYCHCPSCNIGRFLTSKCKVSFLMESCSLEIQTPKRDGEEHLSALLSVAI